MNYLNNSSEVTEARVGAGTEAGIIADTGLGPGIGLRDGAGEVLSELGPLTELGSLASPSSTGSIGGAFRRGKQRRQDPSRAILVDDLIKSVSRSSFK